MSCVVDVLMFVDIDILLVGGYGMYVNGIVVG